MTDITIPPAALEAGKDTAFAWLRSHMEDDVRVRQMTDEELTELVSAAFLAMLKAWPGAVIDGHITLNGRRLAPGCHILPLPEAPEERIAKQEEVSDDA